jgi:hypothetical protein
MPLPIDTYIYVLTRLRYLGAAAENIDDFHPDGRTTEQITELVPASENAFVELSAYYNARNTAAGTLDTTHDKAYQKTVCVYACMKSCYRSDLNCTTSILSLPKADRVPERTLARMRSLGSLWTTLPNVPGTTGPLVVGGTTAALFSNMTADLDVKITAHSLADAQYSGQLAEFHNQLDTWDSFVSAACIQGRALYAPGTPERAYIDAIPTAPSTQEPVQAIITVATSPAAGEVHLEFNAEHATTFEVWHKGPGQPAFVHVDDVLLPGVYDVAGLEPGAHEYEIVGVNSRGTGPASAPSTINVAAQAAA